MGIFARLEAFLERLFEAPAGRLGATLQPVLLTKRSSVNLEELAFFFSEPRTGL